MSDFILHRRLMVGVIAASLSLTAACGEARAKPDDTVIVLASSGEIADPKLYREMARHSWAYLDKYYQPATGFVNATPDWYNTTLWDLGGQLLAFQAAKELGLMTADDYATRTKKTLATLESARLFDDIAFNRIYSTRDGSMNQQAGAG